jgi:hypothetical protein
MKESLSIATSILAITAIVLACVSVFYWISAERTWKRVDEIRERTERLYGRKPRRSSDG